MAPSTQPTRNPTVPEASRSRPAAPLVIGGMGGSGTRVFREVAAEAGYRMLSANALLRRLLRHDPHDNLLLRKLFYSRWIDRYRRDELGPLGRARMRAELRTLLFLSGPTRYGRGRWGWKNPRTIFLLPLLNEMYPDLRFVHVVRDGRDIAFTPNFGYRRHQGHLIDAREETLPDPVRKGLLWARTNDLGRHAGETFLRGRYHLARFEDMVRDPEGEARRLFAFLQGGDEAAVERVAAYVRRPSSFERWRGQPRDELVRVEAAIGEDLLRFGYRPATAPERASA